MTCPIPRAASATVRAATAPAWAYSGGLPARVDLYQDAIIVTGLGLRGWEMRRSEVLEIARERSSLAAAFVGFHKLRILRRATKLIRAHDHGWLATTDEEHERLETWLAGALTDDPQSA